MNRRKYLAAAASGVVGALSGCTSASSSIGDIVEERSGYSTTGVTADISTRGRSLLIRPTETIPVQTRLHQDGEEVTSVSMRGVNTPARQELFNCPTVGTPDNQLFEPGTIELVFIDEGGEELDRQDWIFQPHLVVEDFTIATVSDYDPRRHLSEATPVFKLRNIGTGPTCLSSIEITNPRKTVQLGTQSSPMLRTGTFAPDGNRVSIHEAPYRESQELLPAERNFYFAIDDLFTVDSDSAKTPSDAPKKIEQSFDLVAHTQFGESYTTTVTVAMVGGITQPSTDDAPWTHRYQTVRLRNTSHTTPNLPD